MSVELSDGRRTSLFCKYGPGYVDEQTGHTRGVAYEADVYTNLLPYLDVRTVSCRGARRSDSGGLTLLVLDYLPWALPIHASSAPGALARAAAELGSFHCSIEPAFASTVPNRFDDDYYARWSARLPRLAAGIGTAPWLADLCAGWTRAAQVLSSAARGVVHGELYSSNVLVHRGDAYLLDWESAALGPGELDLAALTVGRWPSKTVAECEEAYVARRYRGRAQPGFAETMAAARVYVLMHLLSGWLAEAPDRIHTEPWAIAQLQRAGAALGILE